MGTKEKDFVDMQGEDAEIDVMSRPSILARYTPFMALEGLSSIEVEQDGIFISLPVPPLPSEERAAAAAAASGGMNSETVVPIKRQQEVVVSLPAYRKVRRGLQIPAADNITVHCTQPASLVIVIPLSRRASPDGSDAAAQPVTLPWSYIRILNPTASGAKVTSEQSEFEEHEAASFGSILMTLEMFMSSLGSTVTELRLCIACGDRTHRDALACAVRAMVGMGLGPSKEERIAAMPWNKSRGAEGGGASSNSSGGGDAANAVMDLARRLKELERENAQLKHDRFDMFVQVKDLNMAQSCAESHDSRAHDITVFINSYFDGVLSRTCLRSLY